MTANEKIEHLNEQIVRFINMRRKLQLCKAIEIITKDETYYLFNNPEEEEKYIRCFMDGLNNKITSLIEEKRKIENESEVK